VLSLVHWHRLLYLLYQTVSIHTNVLIV